MYRVVLGLGTNMGNREAQLTRAAMELRGLLGAIILSPVYESPALIAEGAPPEWNLPYLNMAVAGDCSLEPDLLLRELKSLEQQIGRKIRGHWAPREIDIDILAWGDRVVRSESLTIPHTYLLERDFALVPLCDIAPDWNYPVAGIYKGKTAMELVRLLHPRHAAQLQKASISITLPA